MKILLASPRGFCAGVDMAVDVVERLLEVLDGDTLHVHHEIVHNRHVVDRFVRRGVVFVDEIAEVPRGGVVVYSAHGVSPAVRDVAEARGLTVIDATCPLVTKVHAEAIRYARRGWQILLIGHREHQEIIGTAGEAPESIQVVESAADISSLAIHDPAKLIYLTQTTLSTDEAAITIKALKLAFPEIKDPPSDDICYATTNRQAEVRRLARESDLVLVVGSLMSSNSQRLCEIAESQGAVAHLIDDRHDLQATWFEGVETLLVTAGASAPEDLVQDLLRYLVEDHGGAMEHHEERVEDIAFELPLSLRRFVDTQG